MKFSEVPAGSMVRQAGEGHRPTFVKIAQAFEGSIFMRYPDGKEFPVNAISLIGEPGEFDPDMEGEILDMLNLVMSPSEVDEKFNLRPGTARQTIAHDEWPAGSWRKASGGALLISAEAAERRYGYRLLEEK